MHNQLRLRIDRLHMLKIEYLETMKNGRENVILGENSLARADHGESPTVCSVDVLSRVIH